jgi:hypothetical protein
MELLPASAMGRSFESYQQIEGSYGEHSYILNAYVKADSESLLIIAFNSLGTQVFELVHHGGFVRFSTVLPSGNLKPEYILADFQLCYFPATLLRETLKAAGLSFEEREEGDELIRTVSSENRIIIEIRRAAGEVRYRNFLRGYQYVVK